MARVRFRFESKKETHMEQHHKNAISYQFFQRIIGICGAQLGKQYIKSTYIRD
jgi:hypothetical protein